MIKPEIRPEDQRKAPQPQQGQRILARALHRREKETNEGVQGFDQHQDFSEHSNDNIPFPD